MIDQLTGTLLRHSSTELVLEVNGIAFLLQTTLPASSCFSTVGERYTIPTRLQFKEDAVTLFGFSDQTERELFEVLITISGIGPKTALRILSGTTPAQLYQLIVSGDSLGLSKIKGIGKKTAEMLVIQLKGDFAKRSFAPEGETGFAASTGNREALQALLSLGVKEAVAQKAIEKVEQRLGTALPVQTLITEALRHT